MANQIDPGTTFKDLLPSSTTPSPFKTAPSGFVNSRSSALPATFSQMAPNTSMTLFTSPLLNPHLGPVAQGILNTYGRWGSIPDDAVAQIARLPEAYQPFAVWLVMRQRFGDSANPSGTKVRVPGSHVAPFDTGLSKELDPQGLSNLILHAAPGFITFRSAVQTMLGTGLGSPGASETQTVGQKDLAAAQKAGWKVVSQQGQNYTISKETQATVPANPSDPNFQRAALAYSIAKGLFPHAEQNFESGGILGQTIHNLNQV